MMDKQKLESVGLLDKVEVLPAQQNQSLIVGLGFRSVPVYTAKDANDNIMFKSLDVNKFIEFIYCVETPPK
jgi:hypothetical protein